MNPEQEEKLYKQFSDLFRERKLPLASSNMPLGIQFEDGWYDLIFELCKNIQNIVKENNLLEVSFHEVSKSEDGALKIGIRNSTSLIDSYIASAIEGSRYSCEICSYSPSFQRKTKSSGKNQQQMLCGQCFRRSRGPKAPKHKKGPQQPSRRSEPTIVQYPSKRKGK